MSPLFVRWVFSVWDGKGVSAMEADSNEFKI
jgi:hypothetical protein